MAKYTYILLQEVKIFKKISNLKAIFAILCAAKATMVTISNLWHDFSPILPIFLPKIIVPGDKNYIFGQKTQLFRVSKISIAMAMGSVPYGLGPHSYHEIVGWPNPMLKLKILKKIKK